MGRQSSRIWYQNKDHKEMVTLNGNRYQYHDKAYIWNGSSFELVWQKLKGELWFKKTDIYFYQRPAIIRNQDGSVKFYIDYNLTSQKFRKIYPDATEENITSTCFQQWDVGEPFLDYSSAFSYTDDGKMPVLGDFFRLTKNQDSWLPFSIYDMDSLSSTIAKSTMYHGNYRTIQGQQGWVYNNLATGFRWIESNGNYRGFGVYYNIGVSPVVYYVRPVLLSITSHEYMDYAYAIPSSYTYCEGSFMCYEDFISACYLTIKNGKQMLTIFSLFTDAQQHTGLVIAYEYELPFSTPLGTQSPKGVIQIDEGTILNYELNGTEIEYYLIDILCENYVPFDYSTFEFTITKHDTIDLSSVIENNPSYVNIISDGVLGNPNYLYIDVRYGSTDKSVHVRYDIDNEEVMVIHHVDDIQEVDPTFTNYGVEENLVVVRIMRNAPNYCLCEITDERPNE